MKASGLETVRGGFLMVFRWLVHYPIVHGTYRLRNWTRAPFLMQPELQDKPGILVSNYGNYFYDDILGAMLGPVWPFGFVRDSVYRFPLFRWGFRLFRNVPFIRSDDSAYTPEQRRSRNEKTLGEVAERLRNGHWFSVFPETQPGHRAKILTPLKPGVAHVALKAEELAGWKAGLHIYVYGTNYENKFAGRSFVYIRWAKPIAVARFKEAYLANPLTAEQALMNEVEQALHAVVLEASTIEQLGFAHRLAYQRKQANFTGVEQALREVESGKSSPEDLRRIVCRAGESVVYQVLGLVLWTVGSALGWPFRTFGKLCAAEPSEEMTYQFILWIAVFIAGVAVGADSWIRIQLVVTWAAMVTWLWGWRRGWIAR